MDNDKNGEDLTKAVKLALTTRDITPSREGGQKYKPKILSKHTNEIHSGDRFEIHHHHYYQTEPDNAISSSTSKGGKHQITGERGHGPDDRDLFNTCRERLRNSYETYNSPMRSLFWDDKRKDFRIKDYYVELQLKRDYPENTSECMDIKQIFSQVCKKHLNILVVGDPGYGKTTFCNKIAYDWATEESENNYLNRFDIVVVVTLRKLNGKSVGDEVLRTICKNPEENIKMMIKKFKLNLLVILDGCDEIFDKTSVIQFIREDSFEISSRMTILVTSRPHVVEEIREDVHFAYILQDLPIQQQEKYVKLVFREVEDHKFLLELLKENKLYSILAKCPLMLHMICCLQRTYQLTGIKRKTDLYIEIFRLLIKRCMKKYTKFQSLKKIRYFYGEEILIKLGKFICDKFRLAVRRSTPAGERNLLRITYENLEEYFTSEEREFILGLEMLTQCNDYDDVRYFHFIHKTFQEFILALFVTSEHEDFYSKYTCDYALQYLFHPDEHREDYKYLFTMFYYGLCERGKIPENYLKFYDCHTLSLKFAKEIYNEIGNEENKRIFSARVQCCFMSNTEIDYCNFPKFKRLYFILDIYNTYEEVLEKFREMNSYCPYPIKILLFLRLDTPFVSISKRTDYLKAKQVVGMVEVIKRLLMSNEWKRLDINLCGICTLSYGEDLVFRTEVLRSFYAVEIPAIISEKDKAEIIGQDENLVALKIFRQSIFTNSFILITLEQFTHLKPYIQSFNESDGDSLYCTQFVQEAGYNGDWHPFRN